MVTSHEDNVPLLFYANLFKTASTVSQLMLNNLPVSQTVTHSPLERNIRGLNLKPMKSDNVASQAKFF